MDHAQTNCREVLAKLFLYLDGEVAGLTCAEIEAHFEYCVGCAKRLGFERELKQLLAQRCGGSAPSELLERIRAVLEPRPR